MADNIYSKIMALRHEFTKAEISKSGHNAFQHFRYLELADFVPLAIELCCKYGLYTHIDIQKCYATMTVINTENSEEKVQYQLNIPNLPAENSAGKTLQNTGALETYIRRYMYMLFLDLAVPDTVDAANNNTNRKPTAKELQQRKQRKQAQKPPEKPKKDYEEQVVEPRHRPRDANNDLQMKDPKPLKTMCNQIVQQLKKEGKEVSKPNMKVKASISKRDGRITPEVHSQLIKYIDTYCPEEEGAN